MANLHAHANNTDNVNINRLCTHYKNACAGQNKLSQIVYMPVYHLLQYAISLILLDIATQITLFDEVTLEINVTTICKYSTATGVYSNNPCRMLL